MAELSYSDNALNAKAAFYGAELIAYVEGDDDIAFWDTIFKATTRKKIHVEDCGGKIEVEKWIEKIKESNINAIVALDRDHRFHTGQIITNSPRILFTFGHSMENTLFTASTISKVIRAVSRRTCDESTCSAWLRKSMRSIRPLVILDIANEIGACGLTTIGDNCSRFMDGINFCPYKIADTSNQIERKIPRQYLELSKKSLRKKGETTSRSLRGHFFHSAVLKYVNLMCENLNRRVSISNDALYGLFLSNFENLFTNSHPHYSFYKRQIEIMSVAV